MFLWYTIASIILGVLATCVLIYILVGAVPPAVKHPYTYVICTILLFLALAFFSYRFAWLASEIHLSTISPPPSEPIPHDEQLPTFMLLPRSLSSC